MGWCDYNTAWIVTKKFPPPLVGGVREGGNHPHLTSPVKGEDVNFDIMGYKEGN